MKLLTREFSTKEKILLLVLVVVILVLCYYRFIYIPLQEQTAQANAEADNLQIEQDAYEIKLNEMRAMQEELDGIESDGTTSYMASYNNSKAEIAFLNDVLADTVSYDISIGDYDQDGNQVRRDIIMQFTVDNYAQAEQIIRDLETCEYRCLVSDVSVSCEGGDLTAAGEITVNATATFYETMVGGTADAGLPEEEVQTVDETEDLTEE